jgi:hypothetical protein
LEFIYSGSCGNQLPGSRVQKKSPSDYLALRVKHVAAPAENPPRKRSSGGIKMFAATSGWGFDVGQTIAILAACAVFFAVKKVFDYQKSKKWNNTDGLDEPKSKSKK